MRRSPSITKRRAHVHPPAWQIRTAELRGNGSLIHMRFPVDDLKKHQPAIFGRSISKPTRMPQVLIFVFAAVLFALLMPIS